MVNNNIIKQSLDIIDHYADAKKNGTIQNRQLESAHAREAFRTIAKLLHDESYNKWIPTDSLNEIQLTAQKYKDMSDESRRNSWKINKIADLVFKASRRLGHSQKYFMSQELIEQTNLLAESNTMIKRDIPLYVADLKSILSKEKKNNGFDINQSETKRKAKEIILFLCFENKFSRLTISNALESFINNLDPQNQDDVDLKRLFESKGLFTPNEIRTGKLETVPPPNISTVIDERIRVDSGAGVIASTPVQTDNNNNTIQSTLNEDGITQKINELQHQRLYRLHNLKNIYEEVVNDPQQTVNIKYFPPTTAWYVGAIQAQNVAPLEIQMREIGEKYNIKIISDSVNDPFLGTNALKFNNEMAAPYPQDFVDFTSSEIRISPVIKPEVAEIVNNAIKENRKTRNSELWGESSNTVSNNSNSNVNNPVIGNPHIDRSNPNLEIGRRGKVLKDQQGKKGIALASALGVRVQMNLTCCEGGNTLIGKNERNEPYMIIGQDSYVTTRALMEHDLKRPVTAEEIKMAFVIDYGIKMNNLHFVEQPADFHLDMCMAIVGPNTIAINDAEMALRDYSADYEIRLSKDLNKKIQTDKNSIPGKIQTAKQQAESLASQKKKFEDKTAHQLKTMGFNVIRVGGKIGYKNLNGGEIPLMNYFNMVTATTPEGKKIVVAMGVDEKYKKNFELMIQECGVDPNDINYLNYDHSQESLIYSGGISCRTKTIGNPDKQEEAV